MCTNISNYIDILHTFIQKTSLMHININKYKKSNDEKKPTAFIQMEYTYETQTMIMKEKKKTNKNQTK